MSKKLNIILFSLVCIIFSFSLLLSLTSCIIDKPSDVLLGDKKTEYIITYNLDGGTVTSQVVNKFTDCNKVVLPSAVKERHKFLGWYENDNEVLSLTENRNYNLVAKWEEILPVITFDYNGGIDSNNLTSKSIEGICGSPYAYPMPTKEGYEFGGWYDKNGLEVTEFLFPDKDVTYVAKWLSYYRITLDSNGGNCEITTIDDLEGTFIADLPIPTHEEYDFLGWYDEDDNLYEQFTITVSMILIAKWGKVEVFYEEIPKGSLITFEEGKKYYIQFSQDIEYNLPIIIGSEDASTSFQGGLYFKNYRSEDLQVTQKQLLLDGSDAIELHFEYFDEENCILIYYLDLSELLALSGATTLTCENEYGVIWVEKVERITPIE